MLELIVFRYASVDAAPAGSRHVRCGKRLVVFATSINSCPDGEAETARMTAATARYRGTPYLRNRDQMACHTVARTAVLTTISPIPS